MKRYVTLILLLLALSASAENRNLRKMQVFVYPFMYTGDQSFSWISAGVTDSVIKGLERFNQVCVYENDPVKENADTAAILEIAGLMGADAVVTGTVAYSDGKVSISTRLLDTGTRGAAGSMDTGGLLQEIFSMQDQVVIFSAEKASRLNKTGVRRLLLTKAERENACSGYKPDMKTWELYCRGLESRSTDPWKSRDFFRQAADADSGFIDAQINCGIESHFLGLYADAMEYYNRAETLLLNRNSAETRQYARLLAYMALSCKQLDQDTKIQMNYIKRSLALLDRLGLHESPLYAVVLTTSISIGDEQADLNQLLVKNVECSNILKDLGMERSLFAAITNMTNARLYMKHNLNSNAMLYYMMSKQILENLGLEKTKFYAAVLCEMGLASYTDSAKAADYISKSLAVIEQSGMSGTDIYASVLTSRGMILILQKDFDAAIKDLDTSRSVREKLGLDRTYRHAICLLSLGGAYKIKGDYGRSLDYLLRAKEIMESLMKNNDETYASSLCVIADIYNINGNKDESVRFYRIAEEIFGRLGLEEKAGFSRKKANEIERSITD